MIRFSTTALRHSFSACQPEISPDDVQSLTRDRKIRVVSYFEVDATQVHTGNEVFALAVDGLGQDLPAATVLRKQLETLIDEAVRDS